MTANPRTCPSCGAANDPGALVCRQCGGEIPFATGQPAPFSSDPPPFTGASPAAPAPEPPAPPRPVETLRPPAPPRPVESFPPAAPPEPPVFPEPALPPQPAFEVRLEPALDIDLEPAAPAPADEPEVGDEVRRLVAAGRKVQAIVLLRERAGLTPQAAKAIVDELAGTLAPEPGRPTFASDRRPAAPVWQPPPEFRSPSSAEPAEPPVEGAAELPAADLAPLLPGLNLPPEVEAAVCDLTMRGMKIQAIQVLRANTGLGLYEAKAAVDRLGLMIGAPSARPAGCFIATACYGSAEHPDVVALRRFRDERLLPTSFGRAAVRAYYAASPPLARWLERRAGLAGLLRRLALEPLVRRLRR